MQKIQLFIILLLSSISLLAQSNVSIQINHLLDSEQFENNVISSNDLGNDFKIDRLQYYLSGFEIVHDGGQVIDIHQYELVSLLDETDPTFINLGDHDIENLESISFHFGVDSEANHGDPSQHIASHPLAPQFPSMHWGWTAGYRFIALEGKSGPSVDQELQFHCIGDEFYMKMEFPVNMSDEAAFTVKLDAEYKNLLQTIDISSGLILHGNLGEIQTLATNMTENVFTVSGITKTLDSELVTKLDVFPNPVVSGLLNYEVDVVGSDNKINIYDTFGRLISTSDLLTKNQIELTTSGIYYMTVVNQSGETLATRKVVVK